LLYHVFSLSLRDVELLLAERGVVVSYESIRRWFSKFGASAGGPLPAAERARCPLWRRRPVGAIACRHLRLLSNPAINVDDILVRWVPYIIGARTAIVVALDWTDFVADRGFGDQKLYQMLIEELYFDYVIRFRASLMSGGQQHRCHRQETD
jgi:hypothetical protein